MAQDGGMRGYVDAHRSVRERATLLAFFLPLTRRTCAELGVGDDTIADYLADILVEFARTERLPHLSDPDGRRLASVLGMLEDERVGPAFELQRLMHRTIGDHALFMSGLFRPFAERQGQLGYYLREGAHAYARAGALTGAEPSEDDDAQLFCELSARFEHYSSALDYLRKIRLPGLAGPHPVRGFLRDLRTLLGPVQLN